GSRVYYGTDTRAAELLIGALLAVVLARRPADVEQRAHPLATIAGVGALTAMFVAWTTVAQTSSLLAHGGLAVHAVLVAIVITVALRTGPVATTLSFAPLAALGTISYGVYLFHWPLFLWLTPQRTHLDGVALFGVRIALTLVLAIASYRFLE